MLTYFFSCVLSVLPGWLKYKVTLCVFKISRRFLLVRTCFGAAQVSHLVEVWERVLEKRARTQSHHQTLFHGGDGTSHSLSASFVLNASLSNIPHRTSKHTDGVCEKERCHFLGFSDVNLLFHLKEITFAPESRKHLLAATV